MDVIRGAIDAVTKPFRKPEGYTSAKEEEAQRAAAAKQAAPQPQPQPQQTPQLGGMNLGAIRKREEAAGLKHGGMVRGPGSGTSDSVPDQVPQGSYIVPADTTQKVNLSNGEFKLPPEVVMAAGAAALDAVRQATHQFVDGDADGMNNGGMACPPGMPKMGAKRKGMADGGLLTNEDRQRNSTYPLPPAKPAPYPVVETRIPATNGMQERPVGAATLGAFNSAQAVGAQAAATHQRPTVAGTTAMAPTPAAVASAATGEMPYSEQMANVGRAVVNAPIEAFKTIVGAPGYGINKPSAPSAPAAATPATPTAPAAATPSTQPNARDQILARPTEQTPATPAVQAPPAAVVPQAEAPADPGQTSADRIATMNRAGAIYRDIAAANAGTSAPAVIPPDRQAERNARFDEEQLRYEASRVGGRGAEALLRSADAKEALRLGAVRGEADREAQAAALATREAGETSRTNARIAAETAQADRRQNTADAEAAVRIGAGKQALSDAQRAAKLRAQLETTTDEATRKRLERQLLVEQGKEPGANRYTVVPGGQTVDASGQVIREPSRVLDNQTGQMVDQGGGAAPRVTPRADYDKLPKGASYVGPDGKNYIKG